MDASVPAIQTVATSGSMDRIGANVSGFSYHVVTYFHQTMDVGRHSYSFWWSNPAKIPFVVFRYFLINLMSQSDHEYFSSEELIDFGREAVYRARISQPRNAGGCIAGNPKALALGTYR